MKTRPLLECTIDLTQPVEEIAAVITTVLGCHPDKQTDILRALDEQIRIALVEIESKGSAEETEV
ncbi:hypothetical protein [Paenibacillus apiarius]|uniref:hypothetical protein n=1 Tax=Paenibacillus apiarius TaxID=46240 RepID=UPI003B3B6B10